jgi:two-component system, chemotaxis family, chemotaxis protein CheY
VQELKGNDLKTILIVEDDPDLQEALADLLQSRGYTVSSANDGAKALQRLRESEAPGLILLDLMMPVMDGHEFLAHRNADPVLAGIPVVVISAGRHPQGSVATGAAEVLYKPFESDDLIRIVRRYCD